MDLVSVSVKLATLGVAAYGATVLGRDFRIGMGNMGRNLGEGLGEGIHGGLKAMGEGIHGGFEAVGEGIRNIGSGSADGYAEGSLSDSLSKGLAEGISRLGLQSGLQGGTQLQQERMEALSTGVPEIDNGMDRRLTMEQRQAMERTLAAFCDLETRNTSRSGEVKWLQLLCLVCFVLTIQAAFYFGSWL